MRAIHSVSIIINNYNYARYVGRAIESALAQTHSSVEVIVVDDGSTDDSLSIINRYTDRLRCISKPNGGQASTFNIGFPASSGDIVLFLDSDDVLESEAAAAVAARWHSGTAKAQFLLTAVDALERPLGYTVPTMKCRPGREMTLLRTYGEYPSPPCSGNAYARSVLAKLLPIPEGSWPDGYLIPLAAFLGDIVYLPDALGRYRIHGQNDHARVDLGAIRRILLTNIVQEEGVKKWAAASGSPISHALATRVPAHCKTRLVSLRLDPAGHPFASDTVSSIVRSGIAAAWRYPHITWRKKLAATLAFPVLGVVPRRILRKRLKLLFPLRSRRAQYTLSAGFLFPSRVS